MTSPRSAVRCRRRSRRTPQFQSLERRSLLAAVPFGASANDTGEFMLGEVLVTVVLLESNGQIDVSAEDWQPQTIARVKQNLIEGLEWWEEQLVAQQSVHSLEFKYDFQFADNPISTAYEPISRKSDDFELWIEDVFATVGHAGPGSFSDRIRQFNHAQRLAHETHWAFTVFVVSAESDADARFATGGSFSQSFAFAGGQFFVTHSLRPASTYAHETAHMFWAMDEYAGGRTYFDQRGYYNTQNLNAVDGHPSPSSRVRSIMDSTAIGYAFDAVSSSALETIGWKDSDGDGIFDVLDVPHLLVGTGEFDRAARRFVFRGSAEVQTLQNLNPSGTGNSLTINQIDRIEVRYGDSTWQTLSEPRTYQTELNIALTIPIDVTHVELRAVDAQSGVTSNVFSTAFDAEPSGWQNPADPADVNADTMVTPLDALLIVNQLNLFGPGLLGDSAHPPPYLDVNGDGFLSPIDALMVINRLNSASPSVQAAVRDAAAPEAERSHAPWFDWLTDVAGASRLRRRGLPFDEALSEVFEGGWVDDPRSNSLGLADFR